MGSSFLWDRASVMQDERILEVDGGGGCTTVGMYWMPLSWTLRW